MRARLRRGAIWWLFNIDRSIDQARRRVQSRRCSRARASGLLSLARDALSAVPATGATDEWFMALHVALARRIGRGNPPSRIIHPRNDDDDDDVARVSTCLTPVGMIFRFPTISFSSGLISQRHFPGHGVPGERHVLGFGDRAFLAFFIRAIMSLLCHAKTISVVCYWNCEWSWGDW